MGSPVSAVIANLVMEDVEQRALASVPVSLSFWKRFVDDVISAVSRNEIDILLQHLNYIEPSIQFTVEREINGHLAFSDLNVHRIYLVVKTKCCNCIDRIDSCCSQKAF